MRKAGWWELKSHLPFPDTDVQSEHDEGDGMRLATEGDKDCCAKGIHSYEAISPHKIKIIIKIKRTEIGLYLMASSIVF